MGHCQRVRERELCQPIRTFGKLEPAYCLCFGFVRGEFDHGPRSKQNQSVNRMSKGVSPDIVDRGIDFVFPAVYPVMVSGKAVGPRRQKGNAAHNRLLLEFGWTLVWRPKDAATTHDELISDVPD